MFFHIVYSAGLTKPIFAMDNKMQIVYDIMSEIGNGYVNPNSLKELVRRFGKYKPMDRFMRNNIYNQPYHSAQVNLNPDKWGEELGGGNKTAELIVFHDKAILERIYVHGEVIERVVVEIRSRKDIAENIGRFGVMDMIRSLVEI